MLGRGDRSVISCQLYRNDASEQDRKRARANETYENSVGDFAEDICFSRMVGEVKVSPIDRPFFAW